MSDLEVQMYLDSLVENITIKYGYECYVGSGGDYKYAVLEVISPNKLNDIEIENIKQLLPLWHHGGKALCDNEVNHIYNFMISDIRGEIRKSNLKELWMNI